MLGFILPYCEGNFRHHGNHTWKQRIDSIFYLNASKVCATHATSMKNVYDRPQCLNSGSYYSDEHGALHTDANQSFYSYGIGDTSRYGGKWVQAKEWVSKHSTFKRRGPEGVMYETSKRESAHDDGHGYQWLLPAPCTLVPFSGKFWCETLHAVFHKQMAALEARNASVSKPGSFAKHAPRRPRIVFVGGTVFMLRRASSLLL